MAMRSKSVERLAREIPDDALVLDVGGWFHPFARADWVIDLLPYATRGDGGLQGEKCDHHENHGEGGKCPPDEVQRP